MAWIAPSMYWDTGRRDDKDRSVLAPEPRKGKPSDVARPEVMTGRVNRAFAAPMIPGPRAPLPSGMVLPEGFKEATVLGDAARVFVDDGYGLVLRLEAEGTGGRYALIDRDALREMPKDAPVSEAEIARSDDWDEILAAMENVIRPAPNP